MAPVRDHPDARRLVETVRTDALPAIAAFGLVAPKAFFVGVGDLDSAYRVLSVAGLRLALLTTSSLLCPPDASLLH